MEKMVFNCHEKGEVQQPDNKAGCEVLCVCVSAGAARPGPVAYCILIVRRIGYVNIPVDRIRRLPLCGRSKA